MTHVPSDMWYFWTLHLYSTLLFLPSELAHRVYTCPYPMHKWGCISPGQNYNASNFSCQLIYPTLRLSAQHFIKPYLRAKFAVCQWYQCYSYWLQPDGVEEEHEHFVFCYITSTIYGYLVGVWYTRKTPSISIYRIPPYAWNDCVCHVAMWRMIEMTN